jgi:hypothetical protein
MMATVRRLAAGALLCIELEANAYRIIPGRFDRPERVVGLHAKGAADGTPIVARATNGDSATFHVWALDTVLDGVERFDALAISLASDVEGDLSLLIPLRPRAPERLQIPGRARQDAEILAPDSVTSLHGIRLCVVVRPRP